MLREVIITFICVLVGIFFMHASVWASVKVHAKVDWTITVFVAVIITILIGVYKCLL